MLNPLGYRSELASWPVQQLLLAVLSRIRSIKSTKGRKKKKEGAAMIDIAIEIPLDVALVG